MYCWRERWIKIKTSYNLLTNIFCSAKRNGAQENNWSQERPPKNFCGQLLHIKHSWAALCCGAASAKDCQNPLVSYHHGPVNLVHLRLGSELH